MPFNSIEFGLFFAVVLVLHGLVFNRSGARLALIILSSAVFYAVWDWKFLPLLAFMIAVDFAIGVNMGSTNDARARKRMLVVGLVINVGILAIFKYTDFVISTTSSLTGTKLPLTHLPLPVGISFYTFQSISYLVDIYRGVTRPATSLGSLAASIGFFPQITAGPIVRPAQLLPQMQKSPSLTMSAIHHGSLLIMAGLFKKTLADLIAPLVDNAFAHASNAVQGWTGAIGYMAQVYGDFAGYTDIAIGVAMLLGYTFPANFRLPYLATSPSDYWSRWHISLSQWLRDYLFVPLGGARRHVARNLFVTMVLGGLWHGANWMFVVWGAYQGLMLVLQVPFAALARRVPALDRRLFKIPLMLYVTAVSMTLFHCDTLGEARHMLVQMHSFVGGAAADLVGLSIVATAVIAGHGLDAVVLRRPRAIFAVALAIVLGALAFSFAGLGPDFIYLHF